MTVGKPLPHDSAPLHVTGAARYVDDGPLPERALHLAFGLSSCAHGEIVALDLSAVRTAEGVVLVIGPEDLADMPDCSPSAQDEPLLAVGQVHYVGQQLFIVVAVSHLAARRAARLGRVTNSASTAKAGFGTPAMPPKAIRAPVTTPPSTVTLKQPQTAEMS